MTDVAYFSLSRLSGEYEKRVDRLKDRLRKVNPEAFVQELIDEIDTHGVGGRTLRFLENTAMHVEDEEGPPKIP